MTLNWEDQPRHSEPALVLELPLRDGILAILILENRLVVEIGRVDDDREEMTDQFITPELIRPVGAVAIISIGWSDGKIAVFRLNGKNVPRSSEADEFMIGAREIDVAAEVFTVPNRNRNFDLRKGPTPRSLALRQLVQVAIRLEYFLNEMRSNNPEIVLDVAVLLRTLVNGKAGADGGRLLFKCAEEIGMVPVCYTATAIEEDSDPPQIFEGFCFCRKGVATGFPKGKSNIKTNFETWLNQTALYMPNYKIPHWQLIRDVANQFGAHAQTNKKSVIFSFMSAHDAGINLGVLVPMFRSYGELALEICKIVIERAREPSPK